jgi:hypothetical protein
MVFSDAAIEILVVLRSRRVGIMAETSDNFADFNLGYTWKENSSHHANRRHVWLFYGSVCGDRTSVDIFTVLVVTSPNCLSSMLSFENSCRTLGYRIATTLYERERRRS